MCWIARMSIPILFAIWKIHSTKKQPWTGRLLVRRKISAASHFANQLTPRAFDAPEFWVELTITPILNRDGSVAGYLQIQHDITEQLLKEANQQRAKKDSSTVVINRDVYSQAAWCDLRLLAVFSTLVRTVDVDLIVPWAFAPATNSTLERIINPPNRLIIWKLFYRKSQ